MSSRKMNLEWRYATKIFDPQKTVSDENIKLLFETLRMSPSSFGLQPYKILVIKDIDVRKKLKEYTWNQNQVVDASHLLVFCSYKNIDGSMLNTHIENIATTRKLDIAAVEPYKNRILGFLKEKNEADVAAWTTRQAYLALGFLMSACAELEIDSCPMEGFEPDRYDEILQLNEQGLKSDFVFAMGYRSKDDAYQYLKKVRKTEEDLFEWR